jgi:hypothetical protein
VKNWLFLAIAIFGEVVATSALKSSHGFTKLVPSVVVVAGYGLAFYFSLSQSSPSRSALLMLFGLASASYLWQLSLDLPWPETRLVGVRWHGTYR